MSGRRFGGPARRKVRGRHHGGTPKSLREGFRREPKGFIEQSGGSVDLGQDHAITFVNFGNVEVGAVVRHIDPDGKDCAGMVWFDTPMRGQRPLWTVESRDPLTITPSLQCNRCPDHGYVRGGGWVPA